MAGQVIHLHRDAPPKPALGDPCNRCGVCCAAETCPAGRLVFRQKSGPCPALVWVDGQYTCELATAPSRYIRFLPHLLSSFVTPLFRRWIAAGKGCDSAVEVVNPR